MRTLAIETASEACSVALFDEATLIAHDHRVLGRGHAEQLVPMIAALPHKGHAERIFVSLGPGSFTGVRIGIATARALGFAWRAKVLGYPTLMLIAAMAQQQCDEDVTVCMNGGHGEWFVQNFARNHVATSPACSLKPDAALRARTSPYLAGNRAAELAELDPDRGLQTVELLPDARQTTLLHDHALIADLAPIYGRAPDAKPQRPKVAG